VVLPFPWIRVVGSRAIISGLGPTHPDGSLAQPLGRVGTDVTLEQARCSLSAIDGEEVSDEVIQ
jgi:hypothetical protein